MLRKLRDFLNGYFLQLVNKGILTTIKVEQQATCRLTGYFYVVLAQARLKIWAVLRF